MTMFYGSDLDAGKRARLKDARDYMYGQSIDQGQLTNQSISDASELSQRCDRSSAHSRRPGTQFGSRSTSFFMKHTE